MQGAWIGAVLDGAGIPFDIAVQLVLEENRIGDLREAEVGDTALSWLSVYPLKLMTNY
jgi:hypothetical protein